jgi:hypothetical protein
MKKAQTPAQRQRQAYRDSNGKYSEINRCYVCNKRVGIDHYYSHPDTDREINDDLLVLCKGCYNKLKDLPGKEAITCQVLGPCINEDKL